MEGETHEPHCVGTPGCRDVGRALLVQNQAASNTVNVDSADLDGPGLKRQPLTLPLPVGNSHCLCAVISSVPSTCDQGWAAPAIWVAQVSGFGRLIRPGCPSICGSAGAWLASRACSVIGSGIAPSRPIFNLGGNGRLAAEYKSHHIWRTACVQD